MTKASFRAAAPLLFLGSAALLIGLLVSGILSFGHRVTTYYTPSILAYQDLLRSIDHLEDFLRRGHGRLAPDHPALVHFADALEQVESLRRSAAPMPGLDAPADPEPLGDALLAILERGDQLPDPGLPSRLRDIADRHLTWHEAELSRAMTKIGIMSVSTGALCLFLFGLGTWGSLRERRHAALRERQAESSSALQALVRSLDARDPYTRGHSDRVTDYALRLADHLELSRESRDTLALAARLHDIGKIGVPDSVLLKEGRLDEEQFDQMRRHPAIGADMLAAFPRLADVAHIVLHHHERWDGEGYPSRLAGNEIPWLAQIISIADGYDAMTSSRPYRKALSPAEAMSEIRRCAGRQWSAPLADAFLKVVCERDRPQPASPAASETPTARSGYPLRAVRDSAV